EEDEAARKDEREEHEHPPRLTANAGEEQLLLAGAQLTAATALPAVAPSIRLRAAAALCCSSCHSNPPFSYRGSPSTRVLRTRSELPPNTTAAAGSSTGR